MGHREGWQEREGALSLSELLESETVDARSRGALRVIHRALSYMAEKEFETLLSRSIILGEGETGGRYHCVPPERVLTPSLPPLLEAQDTTM